MKFHMPITSFSSYITSRGISGLNLLAANSHVCLGVSSIVAIGIFSGSGQDYLVEDNSVSKENNATANSEKGDLIMNVLYLGTLP